MKRAVVTAGASGIGRAMAEAFAASGYAVAVCDIDEPALDAFKKAHPDMLALNADVSRENEVEGFFDALEAKWGDGPDVLCANAGTAGQHGAIDELDATAWRTCFAVNVEGAFLCARRAARTMKPKGRGLIVFTSSSAGLMGYARRTPYAAAKWAVIGMMKSLTIELGPLGIRVNALCPGTVVGERMERVIRDEAKTYGIPETEARKLYSEGISLRTWIEPEEIAAMAVYLDSPMGRKITGQALSIDGHTEALSR